MNEIIGVLIVAAVIGGIFYFANKHVDAKKDPGGKGAGGKHDAQK